MARLFPLTGLAVCAVAALVLPSGLAGGKLDPVKVQLSPAKTAGTKQAVTVELKIDKGWHVYANPVENSEVASAATVIKVNVAGKAVPAKVSYPVGTPHVDKDVGTFKVYEDHVSIPVEFPKTDGAVEISVFYQACDKGRCLKPRTIKLSVK